MWCEKCGKELAENARFCAGCGTPVIQNAERAAGQEQVPDPAPMPAPEKAKVPKSKEPMSKGKKITLAVLGGVLVLAIAAAALFANRYFSPEQKLLRALDEEDYDTALKIYDEELEGEESDALANKLTERLAKVREDFTSGAIDYNTAKLELSAVRNMNLPEIADFLSETETYVNSLNGSRTAFSTAETMLASGNYTGALEQYAQVLEIDENYETALSRSKEAADAYCQEALSKADAYAQEELYSDAISVLSQALAVLPDDALLTEKRCIYEDDEAEQQKAKVLKTAEDYAKNGDYENALKTIKGTANYAGDPQLKAAYQKYCGEYVTGVIAKTEEFLSERNYADAIKELNDALKVLPDNETLKEKIDEVKKNKPIAITEATLVNGGFNWNKGVPVDPFGVNYSDRTNYAIFEYSCGAYNTEPIVTYAEYRVYGKYNCLCGSLVPYESIYETGNAYVKIYADDTLVYTSPTIYRKTDLLEFEADISGADYIKIEVTVSGQTSLGSFTHDAGAVILLDFTLYTE